MLTRNLMFEVDMLRNSALAEDFLTERAGFFGGSSRGFYRSHFTCTASKNIGDILEGVTDRFDPEGSGAPVQHGIGRRDRLCRDGVFTKLELGFCKHGLQHRWLLLRDDGERGVAGELHHPPHRLPPDRGCGSAGHAGDRDGLRVFQWGSGMADADSLSLCDGDGGGSWHRQGRGGGWLDGSWGGALRVQPLKDILLFVRQLVIRNFLKDLLLLLCYLRLQQLLLLLRQLGDLGLENVYLTSRVGCVVLRHKGRGRAGGDLKPGPLGGRHLTQHLRSAALLGFQMQDVEFFRLEIHRTFLAVDSHPGGVVASAQLNICNCNKIITGVLV